MTAPAPAPFAWELPADARIVALVFRRSEAERSATAVDAIATSIARRRGRTLVLNAESGPSPLDELAGASDRADAGGMADFLGGQAGLAGIAVRRADCPYVYLPAGRVPEGVVGLLESAALARFVARVKEQDGTLFIAMSDRVRPSDDLLALLDGYIAVGSVPPEDHGVRCYGHVPFESGEPAASSEPAEPSAAPEAEPVGDAAEPRAEPVEDVAESPAEPESRLEPEPRPESAPPPPPEPELAPEPDAASVDSPPAPAKPRGRRPRGPLVAALLIVALAAGNLWAYRNGWFDRAFSRVGSMIGGSEGAPAAVADDTQLDDTPSDDIQSNATQLDDTPSDDVSSGDVSPGDIPPGDVVPEDLPQPPDAAAIAAAFESAAERPYSVLLGSFVDPGEAAERLAEIRALRGDVLYVTAPTTVREVRYQRILAGAVATEAEAAALMEALAAAGVAREANPWLLRPVRFAYDLGVFAERPGAAARIAELASRGIPAYSLETALDGMPVFRVYGGAYEDEAAAAPMREAVEAAGETATLIERRGDAAPSTP